jgi:homoserine dehydrogenase
VSRQAAPVRVGLIGFGTIGAGVVKVLRAHRAEIARRVGRPIDIVTIADLDTKTDRGVKVPPARLVSDADAVLKDARISIVIELIGGYEPARRFVLAAIRAGKDVVTANKALLAVHGDEIVAEAEVRGVRLGFEASVGGGIPIIRTLKEGLAGDRTAAVYGIVNGTCNHILTTMTREGRSFEDVLRDAQRLGLAEADPSTDVDGVDSAHKLAILLGLGFGARAAPSAFPIDGIRRISSADVEYAKRIGLRIKLLAVAKRGERGIEARVAPTMIPRDSVLAGVDGAMNAIEVRGELSGPTLYYGAGAGPLPTASAVLADLMELARARRLGVTRRVPPLGTPEPKAANLLSASDSQGEFYVRFTARDTPGVLSKVTGALGARGISIASVLQEERHESRGVPIVFTTHTARQADLDAALAQVATLSEVVAPAQLIRIEREL